MGFLVGVALNLANSLPDVEGDQAGGARTLAVLLGVRWSFLSCALLIALAVALMVCLIVLGVVQAQLWMTLALVLLAFVTLGITLAFSRQPPETRQRYFYLITMTCLLVGLGWFLIITLA